VHVPLAEQPSAVMPQLLQLDPPVPHAPPVVGVTHTTPPEQQPLGHDPAVHTHAPLLQAWPLAHAEPAPHWHAPEDEQLSAVVVLHEEHVLPSVPQLESDGVVQTPPEQHPFGHEVELQTHAPPEHT